jgi:hypothetical protein
MLQLWDNQGDDVSSDLSQLVLSHATRTETDSSAVGTNPAWILLSLLERNIVVVLQTKAAELLGTTIIDISFIVLPLLLVLMKLPHSDHIDQVSHLWLYIR